MTRPKAGMEFTGGLEAPTNTQNGHSVLTAASGAACAVCIYLQDIFHYIEAFGSEMTAGSGAGVAASISSCLLCIPGRPAEGLGVSARAAGVPEEMRG